MGGPKDRLHFAVEDRLPAEIKAQVDRLLIEGATYDEVRAFVLKQGHDISRSALARYGKSYLEAYRTLRMIEDQARLLVDDAGDGLVIEEAVSKIFAQQMLEGLLSGKLDAARLPAMMAAFAKLQSSSVGREKHKADMAARMDRAMRNIEVRTSTSPETLAIIKEEIYGLV